MEHSGALAHGRAGGRGRGAAHAGRAVDRAQRGQPRRPRAGLRFGSVSDARHRRAHRRAAGARPRRGRRPTRGCDAGSAPGEPATARHDPGPDPGCRRGRDRGGGTGRCRRRLAGVHPPSPPGGAVGPGRTRLGVGDVHADVDRVPRRAAARARRRHPGVRLAESRSPRRRPAGGSPGGGACAVVVAAGPAAARCAADGVRLRRESTTGPRGEDRSHGADVRGDHLARPGCRPRRTGLRAPRRRSARATTREPSRGDGRSTAAGPASRHDAPGLRAAHRALPRHRSASGRRRLRADLAVPVRGRRKGHRPGRDDEHESADGRAGATGPRGHRRCTRRRDVRVPAHELRQGRAVLRRRRRHVCGTGTTRRATADLPIG